MSDSDALKTLKVLTPHRNGFVCTLGGILALGKYPQQFFPALSLTFVVYPGEGVGEPGANQERFLDNVRIEGAIPDSLRQFVSVWNEIKPSLLLAREWRACCGSQPESRAIAALSGTTTPNYSLNTHAPDQIAMRSCLGRLGWIVRGRPTLVSIWVYVYIS